VLNIAGHIYPATNSLVALQATLANGERVTGERNISRSPLPHPLHPPGSRQTQPLDATLSAIAAADVISLGPGSLFTSIIPNLLVTAFPGHSPIAGH